MKTEIRKATDGRHLVSVVCDLWEGDAEAPVIETVFQLDIPSDEVTTAMPVLSKLSCTRTDTREPVTPDPDQTQEILRAAAARARRFDPTWSF